MRAGKHCILGSHQIILRGATPYRLDDGAHTCKLLPILLITLAEVFLDCGRHLTGTCLGPSGPPSQTENVYFTLSAMTKVLLTSFLGMSG